MIKGMKAEEVASWRIESKLECGGEERVTVEKEGNGDSVR